MTRQKKSALSGFTLVELVVVVAIMTVISAIIFANNDRFGGEVVLQNTAYDMALSIRQAQEYGIAVSNSANAFDVGYGVYFNTAANTQYLLFADTSTQDGIYDVGSTEKLVGQPMNIVNGVTVYKLYAPATIPSVDDTPCTGTSVTSLDLFFIRPEPDAYISTNLSKVSCTAATQTTNETCATSTIPQACIVLTDPKGDYKNVIVTSNGQITVQ